MFNFLQTNKKAARLKFGLVLLMTCLAALLLVGTFSTIAHADNPVPPDSSQTVTQADLDGVDVIDTGHHLPPEIVDQMRQIEAGVLSEAQLAQIKALASQKILQFGPLAIKKLEAKSEKKHETRLAWIAVVIILVIPGLVLIVFLTYPLIIRKTLQKRAPNATLKQVYSLYLPQALMVSLVLLVLGGALWTVQLVTGRVLGGVTNPQLVFQRESLQYIIDNRDGLIDNYQDIMVGLANDITAGDPEKPVMDIVLDNALQLKNDPVVNAANNIIQFVMPFLNYISLITFGLLLLFFLIRIRPDLVRLLKYPVDILEAEQKNRRLPEFDSVSVGQILPGQTSGETMRIVGRQLMWNEIKVMAVFALTLLGFTAILSLALILFFAPLVGWIVNSVNMAAEYFLKSDDGANLLVWSAIVLMLFLIECVVVFLLTFLFVLQRLQGVIRLRFAGKLDNKQTLSFIRQISLKFGWVMLVVALLGMGLPLVANFVDELLYNHGKDPSWVLIIIATPLVLIVGLNLGLWLLRGFKTLVRLLTVTPEKVFQLTKAESQKLEPVAS